MNPIETDRRALRQQRMLEAARRYCKDQSLCEGSQKALERYYAALVSNSGCKITSAVTVRGILHCLKEHGRHLGKPFAEATKEDVQAFFAHLRERGLSQGARNGYVIHLRGFYRWLSGGKEHPDLVRDLAIVKIRRHLDSNLIYTPKEIRLLIDRVVGTRNKALIAGLYESACRISEYLELKVKDVVFDEYGARLSVTGKTGHRNIRLIESEPYLREWLNDHPFKDNPEAYFFVNFAENCWGRGINPSVVASLLKRAAKRAGIHKPIRCHLLRHSRLTWLAKNGFNERDLRLFAGWSGTSTMPDTYLHYGAEQVEHKLLAQKGRLPAPERQREQEQALEPVSCSRCRASCPPTARYCHCGMPLHLKTAMQDIERREAADVLMNRLFERDEFRAMVAKMLKEGKTEPSYDDKKAYIPAEQ